MSQSIKNLVAAAILAFCFCGFAKARAETKDVAALDAAARCEGLQGGRFAKLPSAATWVVSAAYHPKSAERRAYCDVEGYVNPTVNFGLWLPTEGWSGRLIVRGCGGSCGMVFMEGACGKHLRDGYACVHTDMGHRSSQIDNLWAQTNLQGLVDFGYRATHVVTVAGKAILEAFYQGPARFSYFYACSTGGRQAMVEAERFPQDFDGIVAVAPVDIGPFGVAGTFGASNYVPPGAMNADAHGGPILSDLDIPMIYKAVMHACDATDGVIDGLFSPGDCTWDPIALACPHKSAAPHTCLTPEQIDLVRRFYAKGAQRGSELNWIDNLSRAPGVQTQFADPRGDPVEAETLMNAGNPDLRVFKAHGGKLLLAHGTTDLIVLPGQTVDYYETATRVMGGAQNTTDFFRLFLIAGMDHCSGGDGAWGVDYLAAMTQWVEAGKAPKLLIGAHPKPGVQLDYFGLDTALLRPDQIAFTRPYFPYPLKAYYSGRGDPNLAASFIQGLRPIGKAASQDLKRQAGPSAPSKASIAGDLASVMTTTEDAYRTSGLPPENITGRIAKAMRRQLYLTDPPRASVQSALKSLLETKPSSLARPALLSLEAEYQ